MSTIPNELILVDTLALQEAKASSQVENIITTNDERYRADRSTNEYSGLAAKEVLSYGAASKGGFKRLRQQRLLRLEDILVYPSHLGREQCRAA